MSQKSLSPIEDIIEDARNGRMFILVDDENRENEGDLVIPAEKADADIINFMAKYGRGLICLSVTPERANELGLEMMASRNNARHQTAFTVSIEAREGVTTGISAADRAHTVSVAINSNRGQEDIVTPGHVFPLIAQTGGVLIRAGHTEAAVDVAKMADLNPSGVICEIMNDDGTMARLPDLLKFAETHDLKVASIADLISYRRRTEKIIEKVAETTINSRFGGEFQLHVFANQIEYGEHIAISYGDVSGEEPVLVRMHALNMIADVLGDTTETQFAAGEKRDRATELHAAMQMIADKGRGVVVIIREPSPTALSRFVQEREGKPMSKPISELRQYGIGAQILLELGVHNMVLLTNTRRTIVGLDGYGLNLVAQEPLPT
ncbi:MAG: 3,4-dihydroxy-2-butanone-4-phosphate synthase [Rhodospirillales bacterium]|nr:3,4-dihydroxy-2-butanone-4-phosphate synthase [Rhodospirillales bacterium]MBT4006902.1 3,4-dihydroxy-2-butanone-4-phosphate synthase [Rhodospirillales bacterium]MBT5075433.1 3,4-dihydroxy-2-butanone-4-phosphate synthase [Rhodospirillales bacterium]MBT5113071.1 3,4-dihydroxy-2-butanone-4-phosphate synthase [Rhodospirillales bacterium]MBT5672947.1 3,4-dihydroxy-2-butanone-4-phosphate synthase [Rhodospirillales bacterium]